VAVVNSHLHFDHCGQNPMYYGTDVRIFVQAEEVEAATTPCPSGRRFPTRSCGVSVATR
jgi:glyoxylase-like metal-dependent hydrolase (beta-lactamase superfamily II)